MADHENAQLFRSGYESFQRGDLESLRSLFSPDIVWHLPGHNHLSGDHRGVDKVFEVFGKNMSETKGTFKVELHDLLANDTHAVAIASFSGEREGKKLNDRYTHVVHFQDGKLTESWIFGENQDQVDGFWG